MSSGSSTGGMPGSGPRGAGAVSACTEGVLRDPEQPPAATVMAIAINAIGGFISSFIVTWDPRSPEPSRSHWGAGGGAMTVESYHARFSIPYQNNRLP